MERSIDEEIALRDELAAAGFTDAQIESVIEMHLIEPIGLSEEDLSEWWETYRAMYP